MDHDLDQRPIGDIINEIRTDLDLGKIEGYSLHQRRRPADIAILCKRAAAPGRVRAGPFNLPVPPRSWVDTGPDDIPPIRGP